MPTEPIDHPLLQGLSHRPTAELRVLCAILDELQALRASLAAPVVLPDAAAPVLEVTPEKPKRSVRKTQE